MTTLKQTKVDLAGLMKVFGEHLYSTPNVAIRELVQNAHDSCVRRRLEAGEPGFVGKIVVHVDHEAGTLAIEDTGAGLTADEIERYLATVGSGYTRELRDRGSGDEGALIGYFGLGFLTAFVVADRTEVWTCSYQDPSRAFQFSSRSGQSYTVMPAADRPVGTKVTLHLAEKFRELSRPSTIGTLLARYCCLLDVPIHLGDEAPVNAEAPPWRASDPASALRRRKVEMDFARRFEAGFEPICALAITPRAGTDARGIAWIHDAATYGTSDNRNVAVFVRGMLISADERDLLPAWAGFMGAVVESFELSPTASRESLRVDRGYEAAQMAVRESLIDELARIAREEPAAWRRVLRRHNEALLGAALSDHRLFDLLADELTVPTSQGDLRVSVVLERSEGRVHVSQAERGGFEELLFRALKVPVVQGVRYGALPFSREYTQRRRGKLVLVGTDTGDRELFETLPPSEAVERARARLEQWFGREHVEVIPARFEPSYLPFVLVPDREVELKRRIESDDADKRIASAVLGLARGFTKNIEEGAELRLYVNLACAPIARVLEHPDPGDPRVERIVRLLAPVLSMLSEADERGRLTPIDAALHGFCETLSELLEQPENA